MAMMLATKFATAWFAAAVWLLISGAAATSAGEDEPRAAGWPLTLPTPSRDCHFADALSPSLSIHLLKVEWGAAEWPSRRRLLCQRCAADRRLLRQVRIPAHGRSTSTWATPAVAPSSGVRVNACCASREGGQSDESRSKRARDTSRRKKAGGRSPGIMGMWAPLCRLGGQQRRLLLTAGALLPQAACGMATRPRLAAQPPHKP